MTAPVQISWTYTVIFVDYTYVSEETFLKSKEAWDHAQEFATSTDGFYGSVVEYQIYIGG